MLLPDLHTDFSRGRLCDLVFPSLSEFSTLYCDPHSQRLVNEAISIVNEAEVDVFSEIPLLSPLSNKFWQFNLWFLCLFENQLEHQEVHGSHIAEAWLGEF